MFIYTACACIHVSTGNGGSKIFPAITAEFHNRKMIPFVLPNVLMIAEESSIQEYATLVLPALEPVFAVQDPV